MAPVQRNRWPRSGESLASVEAILAQSAQVAGTLGDAAAYLMNHPGKRVRVRLCLDLASSLHLPRDSGIALAAAVEFLHGASLVLDDIQDNDDMRREQLTVWRKFGRAQAINLGTFFIAQSFALAARLPGVSPIFASALRAATVGQSAEFDFRAQIPTLAAYTSMAEEKTGALFSLPARAVAILAQLPNEQISEIGALFDQLGAAYQIQDDLADAFGLKGRARAGLDLREGKANSIVIFHLQLNPADCAPFLAFQRDRAARSTDAQLDHWLDRFVSSGSVAIAQAHLRQLCADIAMASSALPTPFAAHLADLAMGIADPALFQSANEAAVPSLAV